MLDLIIKNGMVALPDSTVKCDIGIKNGKIEKIGKVDEPGAKTVDAMGKYVISGMVDTHFHASDPGGVRSDWEGFVTGTKALAAGGATTYVDMPLNNLPATVDGDTIRLKKHNAQGKNYVDYCLFGGLVPENIHKLHELKDEGAVAYKCFMSSCGSKEIEGDFSGIDDYSLYLGMKKLASLGKMLCIHAENAPITDGMGEDAKKAGKSSLLDYVETRPIWTETEAVQRAIIIAKNTGCKIHIMHVSNVETMEVIKEAEQKGVSVTFESCPHYLLFSHDDFPKYGNLLKCSPPLRSKGDSEKMWHKLLNGEVKILSSDHSPCPYHMKDKDNAFEAWGGIAGAQSSVDVMFDEAVLKRGMPPHNFSKVISKNPAELYGIRGKGLIKEGFDGDLVIIDPDESYTLRGDSLLYQNKFSPYVGREIGCKITHTFLRGELVYSDKEGIVGKPSGMFIKGE